MRGNRRNTSRLFFYRIEAGEQLGDFGTDALELFAVQGAQGGQGFFAAAGEFDEHLPAVFGRAGAGDEFLLHEPVHQSDRAVVTQAKAFGEFADGDAVSSGKAFDGEQRLVLLRGDAGALRGFFAEMDETPQGISERREGLVLCFAKLFGRGHVAMV